jgi:hypothetical protein
MRFKNLLLPLVIAISATNSYAWNFIYSHDGNGVAIDGSLQALRNAVSNGAAVKVGVILPEHEWQITCSITALGREANNSVVCIGDRGLATYTIPGSQFGNSLTPAQSLEFTINTQGQYTQAGVARSNGSLIANSQFRFPMRWYVD